MHPRSGVVPSVRNEGLENERGTKFCKQCRVCGSFPGTEAFHVPDKKKMNVFL